jgi:drug/metabolite transporter (DMT)-like permease
MRSSGTLLCLASATCFGAMAAFGKLAYDEGATVGTLLSVRFALAAAMFWTLTPAREVRRVGRRDILVALGLGAAGYALQAGCYFAALDRIDASLLSLLVYTYPAMVAAAAAAIGRERLDSRRVAALAVASGGLVLVLAGAGGGALDPVGAALGLGAAIVYCTYILVGDTVAARIRPQVLATIVCTGAALTLTAGSAALGELRPGALTLAGWGWLACLAAVSTVGAITLFFAGLKRVGPTSASILSTAEPVATVLLAFAVFGEVLEPIQVIGGLLVLAATPMARRSGAPARRAMRPLRRRPADARAGL